jgi:dihydroflavonol-4-reductase
VLAWAKRGLPVSIAGTTCPIGRGDEKPTPTGRMIRDFLQRRFPFYCRTGLNFIGVGDLSRGLQRVAEAGVPGRRYLLSDENLWLKEFLELLAQETALAAPRFRLPDPLVRAIGVIGEGFDLLNPRSTSARACIETTVQAARVQFFDNSRTREELSWRPASTIQENIAEAVAWFRGEADLELVPAAAPTMETHAR